MKVEYDFSQAKRATEVQHLNQLREENGKVLLIESSVDGKRPTVPYLIYR